MSVQWESLANEHILGIEPYEPGKPIDEVERELGIHDAIKLASNENPLPPSPRVQKAICARARALGVPVIVATQVLESMMTEPRPTRAEVSDAANAVEDGVDAVMLSGETAVGAYPIKAVEILDLVLRDAEGIPCARVPLQEAHVRALHGQAICEAAVTLAELGHAAAIVAVTRGGKTAALLSAFAAYAAGFLVRPFGALVFGRIGDLVGRKYTFLVTIVFMGGRC